MNAPAAASSGAFRAPISAASSPCATSTGAGPTRSTGHLRGVDEARLPQGRHQRRAGRPEWRRQIDPGPQLAHEALIHGHTVLFTSAGQLLGELASLDSDSALRRRLRHYVAPTLLLIDEVGYLSYSNRHADLMFELISRRYEQKSTVVTTNRAFAEWREIFPNAACVVSMVDRLMHNAEVVSIEGDPIAPKKPRNAPSERANSAAGASHDQA